MKKVICRADGNASTGLGHLYRMFALYEMYKETNDVVFVTREDSEINVIPQDYTLKLIPSSISLQDEIIWLSSNFESAKDIIIIDGYQFVDTYQKTLKNFGFYCIYVDDLVTKKLYADIVINHAPKLNRQDFNVGSNTLFALGTQYAILRPMFLEAAKKQREIHQINSTFVCFGGADKLDLSLLAVQGLLDFENINEVHVVLGGAYNHENIFNLEKVNPKVKLYQNLDERSLIAVMSKCNFAIVPSSTILYELCCVKMPVLSGYFVANQEKIYRGFSEDNLIYEGGNFANYTSQDFKEKVEAILSKNNYDEPINNQSQLFGEHIKKRFLNLLLKVELRDAKLEDSKLIFDWANDDEVRQNSFNSEVIEYESHSEWYENQLKDEKSKFLIAIVDNKEAGLIRFNLKQDHAIISISIAKEFRGKQLAPKMLIESAKYYFKTNAMPIFAYIKKDNIGSIKSFENAGFTYLKDATVNDIDSVIYQLTENG